MARQQIRHWQKQPDQRGLGTIGMVGVLIGIGVVFLMIFFFAASGGSPSGNSSSQGQATTDNTENDQAAATDSKEPPFIRIPENSLIYTNATYKFSFAYPSSFEKLSEVDGGSPDYIVFRASSADTVKKPVGASGTVLTGPLGAYVYKKKDFKILVGDPEIFVSAAKTGDDTTWKVVSRGTTSQDISIGDAFPVKTIKSQTGIPVFDFSLKSGASQLGRYVFELEDYYVLVSLPSASRPGSATMTASDLAAYTVIGTNIASTVRIQPDTPGSSTTSQNDSDNE